MAILQGARITGSIIATSFIKAAGFSGSLTASNLYVLGKAGIGTTSPSAKLTIVDNTNGGTINLVGRTSDDTAAINFRATGDGSTYAYVAPDTNEFRLYHNDGFMSFYPGGTEKVRITSTGNVGIGTTSPAQKLSINNGSAGGSGAVYPIRLSGGTMSSVNDATGIQFVQRDANNDYGGYIRLLTTQATPTYLNPRLEFGVQDTNTNVLGSVTTKMVITGDGNVGIGTTSPTSKLHVYDNGGSFKTDLDSTYHMGILNEYVSTYVSRTKFGRWGNTSNLELYYDIAGNEEARITRNYSGAVLKFNRSTTTDMIIDGSGIIGMGTTAPNNSKLHIYADHVSGHSVVKIQTITAIASGGVPSLAFFDSDGSRNTLLYAASDGTYLANEVVKPIIFSTNGTERMRVTSDGNVGIGTTSPAAKLHVSSSSTSVGGIFSGRLLVGTTTGVGEDFVSVKFNSGGSYSQGINIVDSNSSANNAPYLVLRKSDDTYIGNIRRSSTDNAIYVGGNSYLALGSGDTERMRIASDGRVGIGTTSPSSSLHVNKSSQTLGATTPSGATIISNLSAGNGIMELGVDSTSLSYIQSRNLKDQTYYQLLLNPSGGSVGIGTTSPSYALDVRGNVGLEPYSVGFFRNTNTSTAFGGIVVNGNNQAHIRFLTGASTWDGVGAKQWQIRTGQAANTDALSIYSWTTGTDVLYINNSGNVGIGTTSPAYPLDVAGSAYAYNYFTLLTAATYGPSDNSAAMQVFGSTGSGGLTNTIKFLTNGSERMRITSTGAVGIGLTNPNTRLQVSGSATIGGYNAFYFGTGVNSLNITAPLYPVLAFYYGTNLAGIITGYSDHIGLNTGVGGSKYISFEPGDSEIMRITAAGNVGIGTSSPSQKLHVVGDSIFNGLKTIQLDRTLAAAINSYTNIGNFARTHGAHSMIVSVTANISSYSVSKSYIINNAYNATAGSWRIALPITDSGPYNDDFQLLVNFDLEYCYLRLRKSSGSTYTGVYSITILYTGYTDTVFTATSTTGTDSSNLSILDSTQLIQVDGNVGIGTTSPVNKLHVSGSSTNLPLKLEGLTSNATGYFLTVDNTTGVVHKSTSGASGTSGTSGANGSPGTSGTSGANGSPGTSGSSGSGSSGISGSSGTSGTTNIKAWVHFDGTGTPTINASLNVSSITDNNTGDYTINFTTAFANANYVVAGTVTYEYENPGQSINNMFIAVPRRPTAQLAGSCRISTPGSDNVLYDCKYVRVLFSN